MTLFDRPLSLAEVLDLPLQMLRREYRQLLPVALVCAFMAAVPQMVPQVMLLARPDADPAYLLLVQAINLAAALVAGVIGLIGALAVTHKLKGLLEDTPITMGQAFRRAVSPAALGTLLLAALMIIVGFVLCCIPGLILSLYIALLAPILVYESPRGVEAISRSFTLTGYNPGTGRRTATVIRVLLVWIAVSLVTYAIASIITLPMMGAGTYYSFKAAAEGTSLNAVPRIVSLATLITQFASTLVGAVSRLYASIAFTLLFLSVRNSREGRDIAADVRRRLNATGQFS